MQTAHPAAYNPGVGNCLPYVPGRGMQPKSKSFRIFCERPAVTPQVRFVSDFDVPIPQQARSLHSDISRIIRYLYRAWAPILRQLLDVTSVCILHVAHHDKYRPQTNLGKLTHQTLAIFDRRSPRKVLPHPGEPERLDPLERFASDWLAETSV